MNLQTIMNNIILNTDSYKVSMPYQYPRNTTEAFAYIEARGGVYPKTTVVGMQMFTRQYLSTPITMEMIDFAEKFLIKHGMPFYREGWEYILQEYDGYLPLRIKAIPEGTVVDVSNVLASIETTDPKCAWLETHVETSLLRGIWYPTTVATKSREIKKLIKQYLEETADEEAMAGLNFKLHDFGARGVSSMESAGIGGAAHLVNFEGSDTITGSLYAMAFYDTDEMPAFGVPASEHSTITSWLREHERDAYENMLDVFGGKYPHVSVVSDSYNIKEAVDEIWGKELKDKVINSGSTLVIRPDSGEPADIVGYIAKSIDKNYGSVVNSKGYKVLNNVRILQGDGLNEIPDFLKILRRLKALGFSTDNVVFGMGGGLLQQVNRDTCKFAMKTSSVVVNGQERDVFKDPITDAGKKSKRGRLALIKNDDDEFQTVPERDAGDRNLLQTVYHNGKLYNQTTFEEIRERAAI